MITVKVHQTIIETPRDTRVTLTHVMNFPNHDDAQAFMRLMVSFGLDVSFDTVPDAPQVNASMTEAWRLTHGDRRSAYGTPAMVFAGYAKMWSGLLAKKLRPGVDLDATDVTLMMTALKLAREANAQRDDNVVDAHGYLIMHEEIKEERK